MIQLRIGNSMCRIEGVTTKQAKDLQELLSHSVPRSKAFFSGWYGSKVRYLIDKRGSFPTGLLYLVQEYLAKHRLDTTVNDTRKRPESSPSLFQAFLPHKPYPEQFEAAIACVKHGRGIITAPTGVGKSTIAALIIQRLQVPTLVVVPSLELKRQLSDSLKQCFGAQKVDSLGPIRVENVDALDPKKVLKGYDCVIIDEFHHSGAETYRKLNQKAWKNIYFKFGLTATPFRSRDEERLLMESVLSQVIYRVNYTGAVEAGYIVPMEAYYYDLPKLEMKGNDTSWPAVYSELVVRNEYRNRLITLLMGKLHHSGASTLCLVKEIAHGRELSELTGAGFANGEDEGGRELIRWFNSGELRSLIGTTGVIGEGVDTKPAEWIILAAGGKSKNQFMQQCGRGFRRYPGKDTCKIILFRDRSHKWLLEHFRACVKYLQDEYGVAPVKLPLPEEL